MTNGSVVQDRKEFEEELEHQFGRILKMPVLKKNRSVEMV